jgi:hypothetical protein
MERLQRPGHGREVVLVVRALLAIVNSFVVERVAATGLPVSAGSPARVGVGVRLAS